MLRKYQQGKGLFSFMAGSVAALAAIAAVLFVLDGNKSRDFKRPRLESQNTPRSSTEVLTPASVPPLAETPPPRDSAKSIGVLGEDGKPAAPPSVRTKPDPATEHPDGIFATSEPAKAKAPRTDRQPEKTTPTLRMDDPVLGDADEETKPARQPEKAKTPKPALSEAEQRKRRAEDIADQNAKPTAEQILDGGSIEKARELARKEAQAKRARQRAAEAEAKTEAKPAAKQKKPEKGGRASIQAGAYNDRRAAEAQRAKLALMGVDTKVVAAESNGKTIYRVQTQGMDGSRAEQVRETLRQNGVDAITRKQ